MVSLSVDLILILKTQKLCSLLCKIKLIPKVTIKEPINHLSACILEIFIKPIISPSLLCYIVTAIQM